MAGKSKSKTSSGQANQASTPPINTSASQMSSVQGTQSQCAQNCVSGVNMIQGQGQFYPQGQIYTPQIQSQVYGQTYSGQSMQNYNVSVQNDHILPQGQGYSQSSQQQRPHSSQNVQVTDHSTGNHMTQGDNGTLVQMIQQMNNNFMSRLSVIERNVSKLNTIESEIQLMRSDVYRLQTDNTHISRRISEVEKSCQLISGMFDDSKSTNLKVQNDLSDLRRENEKLKSNVAKYDEKCQDLSSEIQELKARSMQQNLLFFGLAEELKLRDFLKSELSFENPNVIDSIIFDRVHRLGKPKRNRDIYPRPIVARFERYRDHELIRTAAKDLNLKQNGYSIREQFAPEMEDKRRQLYPVMRKYQENPNNRVALVRDRLYINGEQYIPPAATNTGENQTRKPKKSSEQTTEESRRYIRGARYSQRAEIETNNQFEVLASVSSDPCMGNSRGGKRGLSSPDQADRVPKRYRDHDTSLIDSITMDVIVEETDGISQSSEAAQINLLSENNDSDPEPSQVLVVSHMEPAQSESALTITEPRTSADDIPVNRQTVTAQVHRDNDSTSCQVDSAYGSNSVTQLDLQ